MRFTPALAALVAACAAPPPPPAMPPTEVSVVTVTTQRADDSVDFVGEVKASRTVQVRPQVSGVILARPFREGTQVHAGDVLYRIDPVNYEADLRGAKARLAEAQAQLANATSNATRMRTLIADNAVARQDLDNAESTLQQARGAVDDARATLDRAEKAMSETTVRAEIAGRVGRALLDVGTRVAGASDVLTTIDVVDPVYVSFRPSAEQQFRWKRDAAARHALDAGGSARVQAVLPDGTAYATLGKVGYIDPVVDVATGTQEYRAEFASPDGVLLPGQFVRVKLLGLARPDVMLIPQRAVLQQLGRQSVFVVDASNKVSARDVKATGWAGNSWLVESGLSVGDRVVVDGMQKIGPGAVVRPVALTPTAAPSAGETRVSANSGGTR
jgi:membrane fusion protein (multidrug efflux system)